MSEAITPVRGRCLCSSVPFLGALLSGLARVAAAAVPVTGSLGEDSSIRAYVTNTGGWDACADILLVTRHPRGRFPPPAGFQFHAPHPLAG